LVYRASNWLNNVELPVSVVPEANAVTRPFSNDVSADWLLGASPSLVSVSKAERIAASFPTVVADACSIDRTSLCSVATAVESEVLEDDELLDVLLPLDLLVEVDAVAGVSAVVVEAAA
jgi:hypothetical protein